MKAQGGTMQKAEIKEVTAKVKPEKEEVKQSAKKVAMAILVTVYEDNTIAVNSQGVKSDFELFGILKPVCENVEMRIKGGNRG